MLPGERERELVPALATREFEERLALLGERYRLVPASQLLRAARARRRRERIPVALTFDDDLRSHVEVTAPLLRQADAPATFFVGPPLDAGDAFWWEDLQAVAERCPPRLVSLPDLDLTPLNNGTPWAIHSVAGMIERLGPDKRDEVAAELRVLVGPDTRRRLDGAGIASLAAAGFEVGFHTRRHYPLPTLDDDRLARELSEGRDVLAEIVGRRVTMIAYPHGKADARVALAARSAGYEIGFTTRQVRIDIRTNPLLIGRTEVHSAPLDAFEKRLVLALSAGTP